MGGTSFLQAIKKHAWEFWDAIGDLVTPRHCVVCGEASGDSYLCPACRETIVLRPLDGCCKICGAMPKDGSRGFAFCSRCLSEPPAYDMARSAAMYEGAVREMILALKYKQGTYLVGELARLVEGCVRSAYCEERIDAICSVPLYPTKQRDRGYNQSALIAKELSKQLKVPFMPELLERVRHTPTQTRMDSVARKANVANAFQSPIEMQDYVYGRSILLVDDVFTTGATCSECAVALKRNRAGRVLVVSIAREQ